MAEKSFCKNISAAKSLFGLQCMQLLQCKIDIKLVQDLSTTKMTIKKDEFRSLKCFLEFFIFSTWSGSLVITDNKGKSNLIWKSSSETVVAELLSQMDDNSLFRSPCDPVIYTQYGKVFAISRWFYNSGKFFDRQQSSLFSFCVTVSPPCHPQEESGCNHWHLFLPRTKITKEFHTAAAKERNISQQILTLLKGFC